MKKFILLFPALLLLVACGNAQPKQANLNTVSQIVEPVVAPVNENVEERILTTENLLSNLERGYKVEEIKPLNLILPSDVIPAQIQKYFSLGNIYLALVLQPSMNITFAGSATYKANFFGVLVAQEGQTKWQKLLTISDTDLNAKNNPYYLWNDGKNLFLSVVDSSGAGSGEGIMKVLTVGDKGLWVLDSCYYFGGTYRSQELDGDAFAFSKKFDKAESRPLSDCTNLVLNGQDQEITSNLFDVISFHGVLISGAKIRSEAAYDQHNFTFKENITYPLGNPELLLGQKQIFTSGQSVVITFKDLSNIELSFSQAPLATKTLVSFYDENPQWFHLGVIFAEDTTNKFYLANRSGDTSLTSYTYFDGAKWIDFNKKIESALASKFTEDSGFPNFTLQISPSYIKFTEEQTLGGESYVNFDNATRAKYRKIFILDKKTLKVLEEDKVAR